MKKILLPALAGTVVLTIVGSIFYMLVFMNFFAEFMKSIGSIANTNPNFGLIIGAHLILALLLSVLFDKMNVNSIGTAVKYTAIGSIALYVWFDLWMFVSFTIMTPTIMLADVTSNSITTVCAGAVIAWLQQKLSGSNAV